jgi:hypothetical protein
MASEMMEEMSGMAHAAAEKLGLAAKKVDPSSTKE